MFSLGVLCLQGRVVAEGGCACAHRLALAAAQTDFLSMSKLHLVSMSHPSQVQSGTVSHVALRDPNERLCSVLHWGLEMFVFLYSYLPISWNTRTAFPGQLSPNFSD